MKSWRSPFLYFRDYIVFRKIIFFNHFFFMETVCLDNQPMMSLSDFCPTDCALNANKQLKINCLFCLQSGLGDSNARPLRPERSALPTALNPECFALRVQRYSIFFIRQQISAEKFVGVGRNHYLCTRFWDACREHPNAKGALAQVVEQWTENPCVLGSTPRGTTFHYYL